MLHRFRFVIAGVIIILVNQGVSFAVSAAMPASLLPQGTTRWAVVVRRPPLMDVTTSTSWVNMPGTSTAITIPGRSTGDVMVWFCSHSVTDQWMTVRARLGTSSMSPTETTLKHTNSPGMEFGESQCANFFRTDVGPGTYTVRMQWHANDGGYAALGYGSMLIAVNVH